MTTISELMETLGLDSNTIADETIRPTFIELDRRTVRQQAKQYGSTSQLLGLPELKVADVQLPDVPLDYRVSGVLGEGGMGIVQLAHQCALQRDVAIKRVRPTFRVEQAVEALMHEGVVTGSLEHPNVVPVHALGRDASGQPLIVMKRVDGVEWRHMLIDENHPAWNKLDGDRLSWHLDVLLQVANAVRFAHNRNIVHLDIKPENVMVGEFGEVYLLDWGIGRKLDDGNTASLPQLVGTPAYIAPEMLLTKNRKATRASDIFLLGATLHHVLAGAPRNVGDNIYLILEAAMKAEPYDYGPDVPAELGDICNRACHLDPAQRFQTVEAFQQAIRAFMRHRASLELTEASFSHLAELAQLCGSASGDDATRPAVYQLLSQCRFGFGHAMHDWPENERATDGLQKSIATVASHELDHENREQAAVLIDELDEPPKALLEQLQMLDRRLELKRKKEEEIQALVHDLDRAVSSKQRFIVFRIGAIIALIFWAVTTTLFLSGRFSVTQGAAIVPPALSLFVMTIVGLVWRNVFLKTKFNRNVSFTLYFAFLAVLANRLIGAKLALEMQTIIISDLLLCATAAALAGLMLGRELFLIAVVLALAAASAAIFPTFTSLIGLSAIILTLLLLVVASRRSHKASA